MRTAWTILMGMAALAAQAVTTASSAETAAAPRLALVIGNAAYAMAPALPACTASANVVTARLKAAGFDVAVRLDATNGAMGGALTDFAQALSGHPGAASVVYVCGYGVNYRDRDFVLPVSAALTRPSDVLTEGVVARAIAAPAAGGQAGPALVLLDLFALPPGQGPAPAGLATPENASDRLATATALEPPGPAAATPAAAALAQLLSNREVPLAGVVARLRSLLPSGGAILSGKEATADVLLVGEPPPPPPARPQPSAQAAPPPSALPSAPALAPPPSHPPVPDEASMTQSDRRDVQISLAALGYYDGRIDGLFGPDTRAAIRRWQHEIGTEMTGTLSGAQATRLVQQR